MDADEDCGFEGDSDPPWLHRLEHAARSREGRSPRRAKQELARGSGARLFNRDGEIVRSRSLVGLPVGASWPLAKGDFIVGEETAGRQHFQSAFSRLNEENRLESRANPQCDNASRWKSRKC